MLSIQEVGKQILGNNPSSFYVFGGTEYGIKEEYLKNLSNYYSGKVVSVEEVSSCLKMMNNKRIVPLQPSLYVCRYDESFVAALDSNTANMISKTHIEGTLVCIYESSNHVNKCKKYLPDNTVIIDRVGPQLVSKYLKREFSSLDDSLIEKAVKSSENYSQARNVCRSINAAPDVVSKLDEDEIIDMFGLKSLTSDAHIRIGVASRNYQYLLRVISEYSESYDSAMYTILSTLLELEKLIVNKYGDSDIKQYTNRWKLQDIYYYFHHVYDELYKLRTFSLDGELSLVYLASLLAFSSIPEKE